MFYFDNKSITKHTAKQIHLYTTTMMKFILLAVAATLLLEPNEAFSNTAMVARRFRNRCSVEQATSATTKTTTAAAAAYLTTLRSSAEDTSVATATDNEDESEEEIIDYEIPEDAVINIKPKAMKRLRELRSKQKDQDQFMVLRMGVRNGGCSGLSYVMDFSTEEDIQEDDEIDEYPQEKLKCVVDAKSMLYLYGLELDYSEELIGGGFKFFNPNAEESCGCGSSFGV